MAFGVQIEAWKEKSKLPTTRGNGVSEQMNVTKKKTNFYHDGIVTKAKNKNTNTKKRMKTSWTIILEKSKSKMTALFYFLWPSPVVSFGPYFFYY